jgi:hypothetical protein
MRKRRVYFSQNRREEKWMATYLENAKPPCSEEGYDAKKQVQNSILTSRNQSPKIIILYNKSYLRNLIYPYETVPVHCIKSF